MYLTIVSSEAVLYPWDAKVSLILVGFTREQAVEDSTSTMLSSRYGRSIPLRSSISFRYTVFMIDARYDAFCSSVSSFTRAGSPP